MGFVRWVIYYTRGPFARDLVYLRALNIRERVLKTRHPIFFNLHFWFPRFKEDGIFDRFQVSGFRFQVSGSGFEAGNTDFVAAEGSHWDSLREI